MFLSMPRARRLFLRIIKNLHVLFSFLSGLTDMFFKMQVIKEEYISRIGYHPCLLMCKEIQICSNIEFIGKL